MYLLFALSALAYSPMDGLSFSEKTTTGIVQATLFDKIEYKFYHKKKTVYSEELIKKAITTSSIASIERIIDLVPGAKICRPNEFLEIYEISEIQMNQEKRFPKEFYFQEEVWGYFDPRRDEYEINSIVVTQHSNFYNFQILNHEVAHHWYSSYCLENYISKTSEQFATEIQFSLEYLNDYK